MSLNGKTASKFNMTTILGLLSNTALFDPTHFIIHIGGPFAARYSRDITINAHNVHFPPRSLNTYDHSNIGPVRRIPDQSIFDEMNTLFYLSDHLEELVIIHDWMNFIEGYQDYRMAYYNDIVADITIEVYNRQETLVGNINIYEAFPISVSDVELSAYGLTPQDVTITWTYHHFTIDNTIGSILNSALQEVRDNMNKIDQHNADVQSRQVNLYGTYT